MKIMRKNSSFQNSYVRVRVDAADAEKLLNYLINNGVTVKNVKRNNAFSIDMDVSVSEYYQVAAGAKKLHGKIRIIKKTGPVYGWLWLRKRKFLIIGIIIFGVILYYLSSFIWQIDIKTDRYLAPLEVRNILKSYGVECGTQKSSVDVEKIEKKLTDDIDEVMWLKVRIEGSRLTVEIIERQEPPEIKERKATGNIVASKNGVVNTIYANSGTAVVKPGAIISKGDMLIKGQEGTEGKEYNVMADGSVFATTFYEEMQNVPKTTVVKERTGRTESRFGILIGGKPYYLKKALNKFESYDKIERKWGIFIKEISYETEDKSIDSDTDKITNELQNRIILNLDRAAKILDIKTEVDEEDEGYNVRVLVTVEENIAQSEEAADMEENDSSEDLTDK